MEIIDKLLKDKISTTLVIEALSEKELKVKVENQQEILENNESILKRESILYIDSVDQPIFCSICFIKKDNLTKQELEQFIDCKLPIGSIFMSQPNKQMNKKNIVVDTLISDEYSKLINVHDNIFFQKKYELWVNDIYIGIIIEIFNKESINRVKKLKSDYSHLKSV